MDGGGEGKGRGRQRGRFLVFHFLSSYITLCSTRHQINNGPTYPILSQPEQVRAVCTLRVLCARCLLVSLLYYPSVSLFLYLSLSLHLAPSHAHPLSLFLCLSFSFSFTLYLSFSLALFFSLSLFSLSVSVCRWMRDTVENSERVTDPSMDTGTP